LSPRRRWNEYRKTRNLTNQIATQRAAAEAGITTYNNTRAQVSAYNAKFNKSAELNKEIQTVNALLGLRTLTPEQRVSFTQRLKDLQKALGALNPNTNTTAVYNTAPHDLFHL
jgi:uncharacterized coiled-coil DUF342 family protein